MNGKVLVTGGFGFIGANLVHRLLESNYQVVVLDKMTYAANPKSLKHVLLNPRFKYYMGDIANADLVANILAHDNIDSVMHLAAESHVDRSIVNSSEFVQTNVVGTANLLQQSLRYYQTASNKEHFRFLHVSTDEVFGSLGLLDLPFNESTAYDPRSPYSASKAASDHLVRAYFHTHELPVLITNCSNNYGPYQNIEKFIPKAITNLATGRKIPLYGQGTNIRDWIHVSDHVEALITVLEKGVVGNTYCVGGELELQNVDIVRYLLDLWVERWDGRMLPVTFDDTVEYVTDRPGHDLRYSIDNSKITKELGWKPKNSWTDGLTDTLNWYLSNWDWWYKS